MAPPRVLVLSIATEGGVYDMFKDVLVRHKATLPEGWTHAFVYGAGYRGAMPDPDDLVVDDVEECLVPGVMRKTLEALRRVGLDDYDYVVRTNLSTLWLWPRLSAYLASAPRSGFSAGTVDAHCGEHMCGCGLVWSADVARRLLDDFADELTASTEPDDVALSAVLRRVSSYDRVPRLDALSALFPSSMVHPGPRHWTACLSDLTHVRFKGAVRRMDVLTMDAMRQVLAKFPHADPLLALHKAQCLAVAAMSP